MKQATFYKRPALQSRKNKLFKSNGQNGKNVFFKIIPFFLRRLYNPNPFPPLSDNEQKYKEALKQSENQYKTLVEKAPIGIYTITKEGIIDSFNPKMVELAGVESAHQVIGLNAFNMPSYKRAGLDKLFKKGFRGKAFESEIEYTSHIGKKKSFRYYRGAPLYSNDGKRVEKLLLIVEDITKRKQLENQKDEFTSLVTHELKNPIATINGYVQLLQNHLKTIVDQKSTSYLSNIEDQIHTVTGLINGLLSTTRLRAKGFEFYDEKFSLDELLKKTIEHVQTTSSTHPIILKGKSKKNIYADKERIAQVIINLVQNALRYSPQGKKVIVSVSSDSQKVLIRVQDFGIGIAKRYQKKIFNRFFQVHSSQSKYTLGMGLGLHIASQIIKHYKGRIWVESNKERGSSFYVSLPLKRKHLSN